MGIGSAVLEGARALAGDDDRAGTCPPPPLFVEPSSHVITMALFPLAQDRAAVISPTRPAAWVSTAATSCASLEWAQLPVPPCMSWQMSGTITAKFGGLPARSVVSCSIGVSRFNSAPLAVYRVEIDGAVVLARVVARAGGWRARTLEAGLGQGLEVTLPGQARAFDLRRQIRIVEFVGPPGIVVTDAEERTADERDIVRRAGMGDRVVVRREAVSGGELVEVGCVAVADDLGKFVVFLHDHEDVVIGRNSRRPRARAGKAGGGDCGDQHAEPGSSLFLHHGGSSTSLTFADGCGTDNAFLALPAPVMAPQPGRTILPPAIGSSTPVVAGKEMGRPVKVRAAR